jgi:hypothetical protein
MCKLIMHMYLISWLFVYLLYIITCVLFELLFVELWLRTLGEKLRDFSMQDLFRNIVFMNYSLHPKIIVRLGWGGNIQMANDAAAPVNSVKKGWHASLHTTRDKPPSVFFTFSKLIFFISLAHSTRFWLLLASAIPRNSASLFIHYGTKFKSQTCK